MDNKRLFRGKRLDNGNWVVGNLLQYPSGGCRIIITSSGAKRDLHDGLHDVIPSTVGQCTGLTAARSYRGESEADRLIYEGDAISFGGKEYVIRLEDACFWMTRDYGCCVALNTTIGQGDVEVVGTVCDVLEGSAGNEA